MEAPVALQRPRLGGTALWARPKVAGPLTPFHSAILCDDSTGIYISNHRSGMLTRSRSFRKKLPFAISKGHEPKLLLGGAKSVQMGPTAFTVDVLATVGNL